MVSFARAFISHSSVDKPLVESVATLVSEARWEIDSHTFEEGKRSAEEIIAALKRSDLFVLIVSANSMGSDWVKSELELAQHHLVSRQIAGVLVFIIDDTSAENLPEWIRMHVFVRTSNAVRIANKIRAKLFELDSEKGLRTKPFVQRTRIRGEIEKRIADLNHQISALYLSGVDGIGRRSIAIDTLRSLFPSIDLVGVQVSVSDGEGLLEAYRKLYFAWTRQTVRQARAFLEDVDSYTKQQLVDKASELLDTISEQKMLTWLKFDYDILDDKGDFQSDFHLLLRSLNSRRPTVVLCAKRMPRFTEQRRLNNVGFFKVDGMSDEESKRLWVYALKYLECEDADSSFVGLLQGHVSGHPAMIWTAAEYVAVAKKPAFEANPRELLETLRSISLSLIEGLELNTTSKRILTLFDELGVVDPQDLIQVCSEPDQSVAESVSRLLSLGLLESEGDHLRLASYFRNARFRKQFAAETDGFLMDARTRLLSLTLTYTDDDDISFATVDVAITNAISQGNVIPLGLERAVVGSHYLRVARVCYDREKYHDTVTFATKALDKCHTLTSEAIVECLRLLGMAAVRTGDRDSLGNAIRELQAMPSQQARRHVHFINGFDARWNGDFDTAEVEFGETLRINPKDTHASREIAQLLVVRDEFPLAERHAREALARTPGSPYVIDILLQCLIEQRKKNPWSLSQDDEVADLLAQLDIADRRERSEFNTLRRAHFFAALGNFHEAMTWAEEAVRRSSSKVSAYALRADIKLRMKNDAAALHSVEADIKQIQKFADDSKGARTHASLLAKLRVRFEIAKDNLHAAVTQLESVPRGNHKLRKKLSLEIANEAIQRGETNADVVAFANQVLAGNSAVR